MLALGFVLLAAVLAAPFAIEALRRPMDAAARQAAPGQFAQLPQGTTHYQWFGPEAGPLVVCIHGLTTPGFVWHGLAQGLAAQGYRVLVYDLYGRGYSDRPKGAQTPAFFLRQVNDLMADQKITGDMTVIGYSMGAVIATALAAETEKVRRLVLLAPAGMRPVGDGFLRLLVRTPVLGRWLMMAYYPGMLRRGLRAEADQPGNVPEITKRQSAELDFRGFLPAVIASLRGTLTQQMQEPHEAVASRGISVLAIWGGADAVIPLADQERLGRWNPNVTQHVIAGAGHGLPYTHTRQVLALVTGFVQRP